MYENGVFMIPATPPTGPTTDTVPPRSDPEARSAWLKHKKALNGLGDGRERGHEVQAHLRQAEKAMRSRGAFNPEVSGRRKSS